MHVEETVWQVLCSPATEGGASQTDQLFGLLLLALRVLDSNAFSSVKSFAASLHPNATPVAHSTAPHSAQPARSGHEGFGPAARSAPSSSKPLAYNMEKIA